MTAFVWVAIGGAAGACSRYAVGLALGRSAAAWATLSVNVIGCLLMGFIWHYIAARYPQWWAASGAPLLVTGFCGAFTTMSAFAFESRQLAIMVGNWQAVAYVLLTVALSICALVSGASIARALL
ncbi:MAG: CrcB family protein [Pseudomonadota bacterium]